MRISSAWWESEAQKTFKPRPASVGCVSRSKCQHGGRAKYSRGLSPAVPRTQLEGWPKFVPVRCVLWYVILTAIAVNVLFSAREFVGLRCQGYRCGGTLPWCPRRALDCDYLGMTAPGVLEATGKGRDPNLGVVGNSTCPWCCFSPWK